METQKKNDAPNTRDTEEEQRSSTLHEYPHHLYEKGKAPATPTARGVPPENVREEASPHEAPPKKHREMEEEEVASKNIQGNAERELPRRPPEGINEISEQIEQVTKKLDELRRRGAINRIGKKKLEVLNVQEADSITFNDLDLREVEMGRMTQRVISLDIANFTSAKVLVDKGSSADVIFLDVLRKMELDVSTIKPVNTPPTGFGGSEIVPLGTIDLPTSTGRPLAENGMMKYLVVDAPFAYNVILWGLG
ncbi:hypothetical protein DH2020_001484 [Rehmannia glutinosa]|uniref:Uncharacterized protein n=1 Tax=Rehmannia glutinosa TaxID=99300 RepID=A0ABR0XZH0_REHGL